MPDKYYKDALQLGKKEQRLCVAKGQNPYLPVLNDMIPPERTAMGNDLGIIMVPAEFIIGTRTAGRTTAFARNFMPLLEERSEFAVKWERLCTAHLKEGIRDPIKVYEYKNRFYVEEGNKRVSVLKFFNAVSIRAQVIRILPEKDGSKETDIYYEFVSFYKYSKINFIEFSKKGSYALLQSFLGKAPEEPWTDEERSAFSTTYHYFRQAYDAKGGKKLRSTVGDAMLAYIKIYGYQSLRGLNAADMKKSVSKVWEEITLQQEEQPLDLKLDPTDKKSPLRKLTTVLPTVLPKKLKVAFIYDKTPQNSGWTYGHELGRQHIQRVFGSKIETVVYNNAMTGAGPDQAMYKAIADGATVLFTASPRLLPASLRVAVDNPEVDILNCSLNKSHRYIRTYYARMYEAKFIIGALAGALAENDRVGYICDYPIYGMIAGINAFARGVQMVNPRAKVYLEWSSTGEGGVEGATQRLTDRGIDLISTQDIAKPEDGGRANFGLAQVSTDGQMNIAMPVWHWGVFYEGIIRSILEKTFEEEDTSKDKSLNYYWGMSSGLVDVIYSSKIPDGSKKLVEILKKSVCAGICHPFYGPLTTQEGYTVDGNDNHILSLEQIINMDWLADNVIGTIPVYQELTDEGKDTVDLVGIDRSRKEKLF